MMRRRDFILGVGAAAGAASFGPKGPGAMRTAMADVPVLRWATHFGDDTSSSRAVIRNDGGIANMPTSASTGLISMHATGLFDGIGIGIGPTAIFDNGCNALSRAIDFVFAYNVIQLQIWGALNRSCSGQKITFARAPLSLADGFHSVVASWNSASSVVKFMVDGVAITPTITNYNGSPEDTIYNGPIAIGGGGDATDIAIFAGGSFIEPATVVNAVYDAETGYAKGHASNGHGIIPNRRPQVWLSGPPSWIMLNHTSKTFTWPATMNPTSPSSDFYLASGSLAEAASDPFEPGVSF